MFYKKEYFKIHSDMFPKIYKFIDDKIKNVYNKGRCKKLADNSIQKESTGYEKKMD